MNRPHAVVLEPTAADPGIRNRIGNTELRQIIAIRSILFRSDKHEEIAYSCSLAKKAAAFRKNASFCTSSRMQHPVSATRARSITSRVSLVCPGPRCFPLIASQTVSATGPNHAQYRHRSAGPRPPLRRPLTHVCSFRAPRHPTWGHVRSPRVASAPFPTYPAGLAATGHLRP